MLVGLGVERNLMDSSAHHSAREIIVTHGRFQSEAKLIFHTIIQTINREKNQNLPIIFIRNLLLYKYVETYKFFFRKCKQMK